MFIIMRISFFFSLGVQHPSLPQWRPSRLHPAGARAGCALCADDAPVDAPVDAANPKQLSDTTLKKFSSLSEDYQNLAMVALARLDRSRILAGKPKYTDLEGMIASYMEATAARGIGWTREEAESEVTRYLARQALADEGGIDGDGQDKAAFALLAGALALAGYAVAVYFGGGPDVEFQDPVKFW